MRRVTSGPAESQIENCGCLPSHVVDQHGPGSMRTDETADFLECFVENKCNEDDRAAITHRMPPSSDSAGLELRG